MTHDSLGPRFGWLEAFLASAECLNYERAGHEIGLGGSAQRHVERLERWLHRVLLMGGVPLEIAHHKHEAPFQPVAMEILHLFDACSTPHARIPRGASLRKSKRSLVGLTHLRTAVTVDDHRNFDAAAADLNCSYKTIRDRIRVVEAALGGKIFSGRSALSPTELGIPFLEAAPKMIDLLDDARADISSFDRNKHELERLHRSLSDGVVTMRNFIAIKEQSHKKIDRVQAAGAKSLLPKLDHMLSIWPSEGRSAPRKSASDVDMRALSDSKKSQ